MVSHGPGFRAVIMEAGKTGLRDSQHFPSQTTYVAPSLLPALPPQPTLPALAQPSDLPFEAGNGDSPCHHGVAQVLLAFYASSFRFETTLLTFGLIAGKRKQTGEGKGIKTGRNGKSQIFSAPTKLTA